MKIDLIDQDVVTVELRASREEFAALDTAIWLALEHGIPTAPKQGLEALEEVREYFRESGLAYGD
jgi:hypothetical protein